MIQRSTHEVGIARPPLVIGALFVLLILVPRTPGSPPTPVPSGAAPKKDEPEWVDPGDEKSIPLLISYLDDKEEIVQLAALETLAGMGRKAKPAFPAILKTLRDPKGAVRVKAARTLLSLDVDLEAASQALMEALTAEDAPTRALAARALGDVVKPPPDFGNDWGPDPAPMIPRPDMAKRAMPVLLEALKDQAAKVRARAAYGLGRMGADGKAAVPRLARALEDKGADVRSEAAHALGALGPVARAAVPALVVALKDPEKAVALDAAKALRQLDFDAFVKSAYPVLVEIIRDKKNGSLREQAVYALGDLGSGGVSVLPILCDLLKDKDHYVRWAAAQSLAFGPMAKDALQPLINSLHDDDGNVRAMAAFAVGRIGPAAEPAVPVLIEALKDEDAQVRWRTADALGDVGPLARDAVPALLKALQQDEKLLSELPESAAIALGRIGADPEIVVPALTAMLRDKRYEARRGAAEGLGLFAEWAKPAVPALIEVLKTDEYLVLEQASLALQRIGPQAVDTGVSALIEALKDKNPEVRKTTPFSLGLLDTEGKSVPDLIRKLRNEDGSAGYAVARALGTMGPKAKSAVPVLIETLKTKDKFLREAAAEALSQIDPEAAAKAGIDERK